MATRTQSRQGAQRIREFILTGTADGSLSRGMKLPTERELAQRFAMPRNAVRKFLTNTRANPFGSSPGLIGLR